MILDFIFPKSCLNCKSIGKYICNSCFEKVSLFGYKDNNYAAFRYEGVVRKAIIALKYKFAHDLVEELVLYTAKILKHKKVYSGKYYLIPIPLHKHKENLRGFNQVDLIGRGLASDMNWEFIPDLLIRTKDTVAQVGLKGLVRHKNITGAFTINKKY